MTVASGMCENILLTPAREVERSTGRQEVEAGLRHFQPALADQHGFEACLDDMQVEHVGRGVLQLRIAQVLRAPIGALLRLGEVDPV